MRASSAILPNRHYDMHNSQLSAHELLEHGAYVHELGPGIFTLLPLGMQALRNLGVHIERAMKRLGGQEILLPVLNPEDLWKQSGRLKLSGAELFRIQDANEGGLVLSSSQELSAFSMFQSMVKRGGKLPLFVYQTQIKIKEDEKPSGGMERAREFLMHDGFSFHQSFAGLNNFLPRVYQTYRQLFEDFGLDMVIADGMANHMGADRCFDFFLPHPRGDYGLVRCTSCGYEANQDVATGTHDVSNEKPLDAQTMVRLDFEDIGSLSRTLGLHPHRIAISRLYWGLNSSILAVHRADQTISLDKLGKVCGDTIIRAATETEILRLGLDGRYLSPIGLRNRRLEQRGLKVVVDRLVADSPNITLTVNEENSYIINANFGRDFDADFVGDISRITEDFRCRTCNQHLEVRKAYKIASIYRLGDYYSKAFDFQLPTGLGTVEYPAMGAYGINLGRLLIAMVESNRTKRGFLWPPAFSPYKATLMYCGLSPRVRDLAESIHERNSDILLYEDGPESFLQKTHRADILGIPLRIVVSRHSLESGTVAVIDARSRTKTLIPVKNIRAYTMEFSKKETTL